MDKYTNRMDNIRDGHIQELLMVGETILWQDRPKKSAFIVNKAVVMMPFALLWLCFDGFFIGTMVKTGAAKEMMFFIIPFFAFHLFPVWIWLANVLTAHRRWKNTEYAVTDKRIIIRDGLIGYDYQNIYYTEISNVNLHVGIIDSMLGVGDIVISVNGSVVTKGTNGKSILDIENPETVFRMLQKTVMDIQTDIQFPNAYRPKENKGFQTTYRG